MTRLYWKSGGIAALILIALFMLSPTMRWYRMQPKDQDYLQSRKSPLAAKIIKLGLDLKGGMHMVYEIDESVLPSAEPEIIRDAVDRSIETIRNRVDQFGVAEPLIVRQGDKWIVVQLPGVTNREQARTLIGKTALLEFKLLDEGTALADIEAKARDMNLSPASLKGKEIPEDILKLVPPETDLLIGRDESFYLVKSSAELTGAYLVNARVEFGSSNYAGLPVVGIEFNAEGAKLFDQVTSVNIEKRLAIVLDHVVQSAPVIRSRIPDGRAIIEGSFSTEDAKLLSTVLKAGALPAPLKLIEERTVGPTLGDDSIRAGIRASIFGLLLVFIFMIVYYRLSGLIANTALTLNFLFLLAGMAMLKATLTLPGIAGIILSLGMAVDANVLIFERIKEELAAEKTLRFAIEEGYKKAFSAILDGNLTTLLAAAFMFQFGTGPVKGFAVTLVLGLTVSMFTAIVVTRTIYEAWLVYKPPKSLSI